MAQDPSFTATAQARQVLDNLPYPTPPGDAHRVRQWQVMLRGGGRLEGSSRALRLLNQGATPDQYTNAQLDDYEGLSRRDFPWRPPLTLALRARFSHPGAVIGGAPASSQLLGTAGFGFWNDPFLMTGWRTPALPRALWFFYASPPSNMKLDLKTPGWGWKAAAIDAARWPVRLLLPFTPLAIPFMRVRSLYCRLWPPAQGLLNVCEASLGVDMTAWHEYMIEWRDKAVRFTVDGQEALACSRSPRGPLGLVLWIDNQYLVATPQGSLRYGLLHVPGQQWLELADLAVTRPVR